MRLIRARVVVSCLALLLLAGPEFSPAAAPETTPERLVRAALEAEIQGNPAERGRLLAEALRLDPTFAPARWHSGFVRIGDEWIKLDDVPQRTAGDRVLAAYRKQRDALVDTADNHRQLARWCRKNQLPEEERVHWAHVLAFDPHDAEALAALGLQLYQGRLMSRSQIEREKTAAGRRLQATRVWQPKLLKWRRAIETGAPEKLDEALRGLADVSDPAAIPALEAVFAVDGKGETIVALNRALVDTLEPLHDPAATEVLLRRAVVGEPEPVRDLAIEALKKRPMHAYVPQLIAALPGSLKSQFHVYVLPGGMVLHEHEVFLEGRQANVSLKFESVVNPADAAMALFVTPRALAQSWQDAAIIENRAQAAEQSLSPLRDRLQTALARTTGFANVSDPELWEKQYDEYGGWYVPSAEKSAYSYSTRRNEGYTSLPIDQTTTYRRAPLGRGSCFPAGTKIATLSGLRSIEQIKVGDRVLSQDTASGELAYKPVQATTLRPPVELRAIALSGETILATPGHPFWVVGEGWQMARHLKPGCRLHAAGGPVDVEAVDSARSLEAYNLVVSEFHTYFVGDAMLLVHDNAPLAEQPQLVPGLASAAP
jgi:hypothetical protein